MAAYMAVSLEPGKQCSASLMWPDATKVPLTYVDGGLQSLS